jgi:predicted anti-sigma-YlaC factor YlaD
MLTCKEITEHLTDYMEGRMSFLPRLDFQRHLRTCDGCSAYLQQMATTARTLGKLPSEEAPRSVRDQLLTSFRTTYPASAKAASRGRSFVASLDEWSKLGGWIVGGLVIVAGILLGVVGGESGAGPGPWEKCALIELGAAMIPLVAVGLVAVRSKERLSAGSLVAAATVGAFGGYLFLLTSGCPAAHVIPHALVSHVGGIVLAALFGLGTSRIPVFSHR